MNYLNKKTVEDIDVAGVLGDLRLDHNDIQNHCCQSPFGKNDVCFCKKGETKRDGCFVCFKSRNLDLEV